MEEVQCLIVKVMMRNSFGMAATAWETQELRAVMKEAINETIAQAMEEHMNAQEVEDTGKQVGMLKQLNTESVA